MYAVISNVRLTCIALVVLVSCVYTLRILPFETINFSIIQHAFTGRTEIHSAYTSNASSTEMIPLTESIETSRFRDQTLLEIAVNSDLTKSMVTKKYIAMMKKCWPGRHALLPLPIPDNLKGFEHGNEKTLVMPQGSNPPKKVHADILQVVAKISCVLKANILSVYEHQSKQFRSSPDYVHVVITLDLDQCFKMARRNGPAWKHVRCVDERTVFGEKMTMKSIAHELSLVGKSATEKGAPWFFQQFLKIEAVALGIGGLGDNVRIIDGDVLVLKQSEWFLESGGVVYDNCYSINDGYNGIRYGHVYNKLTKRRLIGGPEVVAHSMSVTRKHAQRLKKDLAQQSDSKDKTSEALWALKSLRAMCDSNAFSGFSEYWYLLSSTVHHYPDEVAFRLQDPNSSPYCIRVEQGKKCSGHPEDIVKKTRALNSSALYVVFETHDSTQVREHTAE
jgi:hypothetical protein